MFCPSGDYNGHAPTGCVPTAMAQIMYFWQYPSNYNWSAMQTNWTSYSPGENTDCAKLMHDIGNTTLGPFNDKFATYGDDETGANDANCPYVFGEFGYHALRTSSLADQEISGSKNGTDYGNFLYNEVSTNNRPCLLAGYTKLNNVLFVNYPSGDAHEWVCDGTEEIITRQYLTIDVYTSYLDETHTEYIYNTTRLLDQKFLHMNWGGGPQGWGSGVDNNGWYDCSINYTQAGDGLNNYTYFQTIIYDIHPNS